MASNVKKLMNFNSEPQFVQIDWPETAKTEHSGRNNLTKFKNLFSERNFAFSLKLIN